MVLTLRFRVISAHVRVISAHVLVVLGGVDVGVARVKAARAVAGAP